MNKILFIDTVTTGMNPEKCSIYRIGGIYTEDDVEKKRFDIRMRPFENARMSDQSLWICGETRASLLDYPRYEEGFASLLEFLAGVVDIKNPKDKIYLAGFNSSAFDVPFLRETFRRNGNGRFRDYFYVQTLDVMSLSAFALLRVRKQMPDFYLETAARYLGLDVQESEKYDCVAKAKVALDIYRRLKTEFRLETGADISEATDLFTNIKP
jgi:DNA polymerase III, epsilon subunit and related 3''-5'' exonucleases